MSPEGENRPMTPEYVALSYRAGMFARLADLVLGGDDFFDELAVQIEKRRPRRTNNA